MFPILLQLYGFIQQSWIAIVLDMRRGLLRLSYRGIKHNSKCQKTNENTVFNEQQQADYIIPVLGCQAVLLLRRSL